MWHLRPPPLHGKNHLKFPFLLFEPKPKTSKPQKRDKMTTKQLKKKMTRRKSKMERRNTKPNTTKYKNHQNHRDHRHRYLLHLNAMTAKTVIVCYKNTNSRVQIQKV